jgi:hypothetical protein
MSTPCILKIRLSFDKNIKKLWITDVSLSFEQNNIPSDMDPNKNTIMKINLVIIT